MEHKLDGKYLGQIRKVSDGNEIPPDEWILFRPSDDAVPGMLEHYREACARMGADPEHLAGISSLIERVESWREANPDRCKTPDTSAGHISASVLREHVGEIMFDSLSSPDENCLLCVAARDRRIWDEFGVSAPFSPEEDE